MENISSLNTYQFNKWCQDNPNQVIQLENMFFQYQNIHTKCQSLIDKSLNRNWTNFIILQKNGDTIGFARVYPLVGYDFSLLLSVEPSLLNQVQPLSTYLSMFIIKSTYRHQGFGTRLLQYIINTYSHPIILEVRIENINAINLYRKHGFKDISNTYQRYNIYAKLMQLD